VDAPGLRSLPLLDEERGLAGAYPEIGELVPGCRFRDCTHDHEPGCAVRAGVAGGSVDEVRLAEYRLLAAEMYANRRRLDPSAPASLTQ
jgi:ribosome biogenesis GTPase